MTEQLKSPSAVLTNKERAEEAHDLQMDFRIALSQLPEFRDAAAGGFWEPGVGVRFQVNGENYHVTFFIDAGPVSKLRIRQITEDEKVCEELTIEDGGTLCSKILYWNGSNRDPRDLPYTPHHQKNNNIAVNGARGLLARFQARIPYTNPLNY